MKPWPLFWRRALKASHVTLSAAWLGAAVCLVLLSLPGPSEVGDGVRGITFCMTLIDDFVIIPTASAVVGTGVLYGFYTKWGFIRFRWVLVKWVSTLAFISFGALLLGPWIERMNRLAAASGAHAFALPEYQAARWAVVIWGAIQTVALGGLVFVSIYKPWGQRGKPRKK